MERRARDLVGWCMHSCKFSAASPADLARAMADPMTVATPRGGGSTTNLPPRVGSTTNLLELADPDPSPAGIRPTPSLHARNASAELAANAIAAALALANADALNVAEPSPAQAPAEIRAARLAVFWESTGGALNPVESQIGLFFKLARGLDITGANAMRDEAGAFQTTQYKMGFNGCATTHGLRGLCCAVGLDSQIACVVRRCRELLSHYPTISLTALGASRGGVAGLVLMRAIHAAGLSERVIAHLCLIDPVPGNLVWLARLSSRWRWLQCYASPTIASASTTTSACIDVSDCRCLHGVLALYPCEALADVACHAPVLPTYPLECAVEEDATLGLHTDAIRTREMSVTPDRLLMHVRIRRFFEAHAVPLRTLDSLDGDDEKLFGGGIGGPGGSPVEQRCLAAMDAELGAAETPSLRTAHHATGCGAVERRRQGAVLNHFHRALRAEARAAREEAEAREDADAAGGGAGGEVSAKHDEHPHIHQPALPPRVLVGSTEIVLDVMDDSVSRGPSVHRGSAPVSSRHGVLAGGGPVARRNAELRKLADSHLLLVRRDVPFWHVRSLVTLVVLLLLAGGLVYARAASLV